MRFLLNKDELTAIASYLSKKNWLQENESLEAASIPGAGNMNYTLRLHTNQRTFIIKQAREYVEKYPQVPAPRERAIIEGQFYRFVQKNDLLKSFMPSLLGTDSENTILLLEDLGSSSDYTYLYKKGFDIAIEDLMLLCKFAVQLHHSFTHTETAQRISNRAMRQLNAEHIFNFPLMEDNGFDLDTILPGLQEISMSYKTDKKLKQQAQLLSKTYLDDGPCLLHGDYYPGSWLKTSGGVKIIDPEFGFFGPPEFDLSVMIAHLKMAQQPAHFITQLLAAYQSSQKLDTLLLNRFVGIEIIRRIIGLAQLPLDLNLTERTALLQEAYALLMENCE